MEACWNRYPPECMRTVSPAVGGEKMEKRKIKRNERKRKTKKKKRGANIKPVRAGKGNAKNRGIKRKVENKKIWKVSETGKRERRIRVKTRNTENGVHLHTQTRTTWITTDTGKTHGRKEGQQMTLFFGPLCERDAYDNIQFSPVLGSGLLGVYKAPCCPVLAWRG